MSDEDKKKPNRNGEHADLENAAEREDDTSSASAAEAGTAHGDVQKSPSEKDAGSSSGEETDAISSGEDVKIQTPPRGESAGDADKKSGESSRTDGIASEKSNPNAEAPRAKQREENRKKAAAQSSDDADTETAEDSGKGLDAVAGAKQPEKKKVTVIQIGGRKKSKPLTRRKKIRMIYHSLVAVLAVLLLGFSIGAAQGGVVGNMRFNADRAYQYASTVAAKPHAGGSQANADVADFIESTLKSTGLLMRTAEFDSNYSGTGDVNQPYIGKNIYAQIKGTLSSQTVLLMAHYDSRAKSGGRDNAHAVGSLLEVARYAAESGMKPKNNILFLFTDAAENYHAGAKNFFSETVRDEDINIKFIANFDSFGTAGGQVVIETNSHDSKVTSLLSRIGGSSYASSLVKVLYDAPSTDYSNFAGIAGVTFANIGEGYNAGTANDNASMLSRSAINQIGTIMTGVVDGFSNLDLNNIYGDYGNNVYFNFLGLFTLSLPKLFYIIMGVAVLGLIAAIFIVNRDTRFYSYKKFAFSLLAVVLTAAAVLGGLFVFSLILAAFGMPTLTGVYTNFPLLVGYTAIAAAIAILCCYFAQKFFGIERRNIQFASACILGVTGAATAFALPEISFLFLWTGLLSLICCLMHAIFKKKGGLNLFNLPVLGLVLTMPILLSSAFFAGDALGAVSYPFLWAILAPALMLTAPSAIRYEFSVPKLKFNLGTYSYTIVLAVVAVIFMICSAFSGSRNIDTNFSGINAIADNSVIIVSEGDEAQYAYIVDKDVYPYVKSKQQFAYDGSIYRYDGASVTIDKAPDLTRTVREETDSVKAYRLIARKAYGSSTYTLGIPTKYSKGVRITVMIKIGDKEYTEIPYVGKEDQIQVNMRDDADVIIKYTANGMDAASFKNAIADVVFSYREYITEESVISTSPLFETLKSIEGLELKAELRRQM